MNIINDTSNSPYLTVTEAYEYLKISESALYNYSREGLIPFYKIKRRKYYIKTDLDRFVEKQKEANNAND